jgi:hypothetical protein
LFTALLAPAKAAVLDPLKCCFNLIDDLFVASEQTEREFLIGIVTPKLFHVGRYAGGLAVVLQGIIFHLSHVTQKACPQSQEFFPMKRQVSVRHFVEPSQSTVVQEFRQSVLASEGAGHA